MIYLAGDTCVWLNLLKVSIHTNDNPFEEMLYWLENHHITCITTPNLMREWERRKVSKKKEILKALGDADKHFGRPFKQEGVLDSIYQPDLVENILNKRIDRLDGIFKTRAEIADEEERVFDEAAKRSIHCIAPNHVKDSFRDTVNILTLLSYIKRKGYSSCYFATNNYQDFSIGREDKYKLHQQLEAEFSAAPLEYIFFDDEAANFAGRFMHLLRSHNLPSLTDHLKEKLYKEREKELAKRKEEKRLSLERTDPEFLENLQHLDLILKKKNPTKTDQQILELLFNQHPAYEEYFMRNLGKNGMV